MEEFDRSFTGPCLIMEPGEQFQPSGKRRSVADYAKKSLQGASAAIVFVVLTTIISYLFGAINPVMSRILMLQDGAIIEEGTYEELIGKGGEFADLVARQRLDQSD